MRTKHRLVYPSFEWRTWAAPLSAAEKAECAELTAWFKRAGLPALWTISTPYALSDPKDDTARKFDVRRQFKRKDKLEGETDDANETT